MTIKTEIEDYVELSYVSSHTIFECIVGSKAYGIDTPESDQDESGVMIPGKEYLYGMKRFDQFQGYPDQDKTIYSFKKAVQLLSENNPNCLDLLYTPDRCILKMTPYWKDIMENAHLFLSKKCKFTFSGYAISQLNRIRTHRSYLLDPPKKEPLREDYGLPKSPLFETAQLKALINVEALFEYVREEEKETFLNQLDSVYADHIIPLFSKYLKKDRKGVALEFLQTSLQSQLNTLLSLGQKSYIKDEYRDMAERELSYYNTLKNWKRYQEWNKSRNKARATLEEKFGFDTKHASHLVRLMRQGVEILTSHKVNIDRTHIDADELKAIRNGAMSFDLIEEYASKMDKELNVIYETSTLQKSPQLEKINDLSMIIIDLYFKKEPLQ